MSDVLAFVFPGQGSQVVGMGRELFASSAAARQTFEQADSTLGYALSKVCFEGPAEQLDDTSVAQPAVLTASVAILESFAAAVGSSRRLFDGSEPRGVGGLPEAVRPAFVAGHSLGEFTALVAAGVLSFADALGLVAERGRLAAAKGGRGAMAAVIGLSAESVDQVISEVGTSGGVVVANDNGPAQVTIAGEADGMARVSEALVARGARKVVPLRVSAPFHFPAMGVIGDDLRAHMAALTFREPVVRLIANVSGEPHAGGQAIPDALIRHLTQRVEWLKTVRYMVERGASTFVEFGPTQVVNGLVKRIADVRLVNVSDARSIEAALDLLKVGARA